MIYVAFLPSGMGGQHPGPLQRQGEQNLQVLILSSSLVGVGWGGEDADKGAVWNMWGAPTCESLSSTGQEVILPLQNRLL